MQLPERAQAKSWQGSDVVDRDGERLGACVGVFADVDSGATEWLVLDVEGHRRSFVPAGGAAEVGDRVRVPFTREQVVSAPSVDGADELAQQDEIALYAHYGVPHTPVESGSVLPRDAEPSAARAPAPASLGVPLAAVGGLVAAVWLALRALEDRARRRRAPAARAQRLGRKAGAGSAQAARNAARQWAALQPVAAKQTRRGGRVVVGGLTAASVAASRAGHDAATSVGSLPSSARKRSRKARRRAAAVSRSAAKRRTAATRSLAVVPAKAGAGGRSLTARGRKARRAFARRVWRAVLASAAAGGYVVGARAGRQRYDEIATLATAVASRPEVRSATHALASRQRRPRQ